MTNIFWSDGAEIRTRPAPSMEDTQYKISAQTDQDWFKIDIRWLLRPPTAIFIHVHSHLNYYIYT